MFASLLHMGQTVPKEPLRETFQAEKAKVFWAFAGIQIPSAPPSSPSVFGHLGESLEIYACARVSAPRWTQRKLQNRASPSYGKIGGGFWNFVRRFGEDPDPWERDNWVREQTKLLHENRPSLTDLLQFIISELDRND